MSDLLQLRLSDRRHKENSLWFDPSDGRVYYGPDLDNLIFPQHLDLQGRLPPLHLDDVMEAFRMGKEISVQQEEGR